MDINERLRISKKLAADLRIKGITPYKINHGLIDNPYIYDGKPIARKYIYYIAKGQRLYKIGFTTFAKLKMILDNE